MADWVWGARMQAQQDAEAARALEARCEAKLARGGQVEADRRTVLAQLAAVRADLARQEALIQVRRTKWNMFSNFCKDARVGGPLDCLRCCS